MYIRISDLLAKPRRNRVDEAELDRLQRKLWDNLMRVGQPLGNVDGGDGGGP